MKRRIAIGGERKFGMLPRILGSAVAFFLIYFVFTLKNELLFIFTAFLLSPIIPALWMTRKVCEINLSENYIYEYLFILGLKLGKKKKIKKVDNLSIESKNVMLEDGSTAIDYEIFLHYDENKKLRLVYATSEEEVEKKIQLIRSRLDL